MNLTRKLEVAILLFLVTVTMYPAKTGASYVVLRCDFHVHTTASDGQLSPNATVYYYSSLGYDVIAITDHNTMSGVTEAQAAGDATGLIVVAGEEISSTWPDGSYKHILALFTNSAITPLDSRSLTCKWYFDRIHYDQRGIGIVAHPEYSYPEGAWNYWRSYVNMSWIDGWEVHTANPSYMSWLINGTRCIYPLNHDFHSTSQNWDGVYSRSFTLLYAHNRTLGGVREALDSRRMTVYGAKTIWGTAKTLLLP